MNFQKITFITILLLFLSSSQIILFDNHAIERIFQGRTPTLFLFTNENTKSNEARQVFQELNKDEPQMILAISDANDGFGMFKRLTNFLDVKTENLPQVLFLGEHQEKYFYTKPHIVKESLKQFVKRVTSGQIEPDIKSAPVPTHNDGPVKVVVGSNFKRTILQSDKEFLVNFYAPWCAHCRNMAAAYQEAGRRLSKNPNLFLAKMDVTDNDVVGQEIEGLPTLKFYPKDKSKGSIDYTGGLKTSQIIDWLKRHVHYQWIEPEKNQDDSSESRRNQL